MTIEEAVETMKKEIEHNKNMLDKEKDLLTGILKEMIEKTISAKNKAIEALEKQIPKKPSLEGDGYWNGQLVYDTWICPKCEKHYEMEYEEYDYCPKCGQAIDWSEGE